MAKFLDAYLMQVKFSTLITVFFFFPFMINAQYVAIKHADEFPLVRQKKTDVLRVLNADTVVFYGLDFSQAVMEDKDIQERKINPMTAIETWIARFNGEWIRNADDPYFGKLLRKKIIMAEESQQEIYKDRTQQSFELSMVEFTVEDIERLLKDYPYSKKPGVGLSIIVERLESTSDRLRAHFTFFSTDKHQLLWTLYMQSSELGGEFVQRWENALVHLLKHFKEAYAREAKKYKH